MKLYPTERLWTSTTIAGVRKYSQFLYRITSDGEDRSHLDFFGLQLEALELTKKQILAEKRKIRKRVSTGWKYLAEAMEKELL